MSRTVTSEDIFNAHIGDPRDHIVYKYEDVVGIQIVRNYPTEKGVSDSK